MALRPGLNTMLIWGGCNSSTMGFPGMGWSTLSYSEHFDLLLSGLAIMLITSTIPTTAMPHIPSVGNELSTTGAFANPPITTLGGSSQYGYSRGLDCPPQHWIVAWVPLLMHFPVS